MFSLNDQHFCQLQNLYHQDLIQEAEKEGLIRYALSSRVKHASFYKRTLCWLGHRLIAWGHNLLKRYEAMPSDLSASTLDLAKKWSGSYLGEKYVLTFAALSFLGLGAQCGYADWGQMISFARNWIPSLATYWYIVVFPGGIIVLFVLAWNLVGDALRDILDPRLRG